MNNNKQENETQAKEEEDMDEILGVAYCVARFPSWRICYCNPYFLPKLNN